MQGVNPFLTISALAERNSALLAQDRGWKIDYAWPSALGAEPQNPYTDLPSSVYLRCRCVALLDVPVVRLRRLLAAASVSILNANRY